MRQDRFLYSNFSPLWEVLSLYMALLSHSPYRGLQIYRLGSLMLEIKACGILQL